ncbi:hypothetical protein JHJ32_22235 [Parapedobacter sp. ISTM3]|uniref:hypothetical protein n=1 Tax=Parapedobacter sp. ISTM3 TaxID=2800130 RepID=UPI001906E8A7|nr:hypothetical protein [Parapedobacter sp. ISTM3]MBK1442735.1 hypothetical protein [Parapedobacter sp. ISTM3]
MRRCRASIEAAKKLARALGVTLDYLGGETDGPVFDRKTAEREHVFALLDAFLAKSKMQAILK